MKNKDKIENHLCLIPLFTQTTSLLFPLLYLVSPEKYRDGGNYVQPIQLYLLTCAPCSSMGYLHGLQFFRMILLQFGLPYELQRNNCSTLVSMGCRNCPSTWVSLSPSLKFVLMVLFLTFFPHTPHCLFSFQSSWFSQICHQFGWWMQWVLSGVSCVQHEVAMAPLHQGHPAVPTLPASRQEWTQVPCTSAFH